MPRGVEPGDRGSTRIGIALLGATLLSAGLLLLAVVIGEPEAASAVAHPDFPAMQHGGHGGHGGQSGASAARTGPVLAIGAVFGLVQIGFFGLCFGLGMRRREGLGPVLRPLLLGLGAYSAVWIVLVLSYLGYAADPLGTPRLLGFPLPTAILLFGFWPLPVVFCGLYLRHFDYVLDEARLARFRERLAALRSQGESEREADRGAG